MREPDLVILPLELVLPLQLYLKTPAPKDSLLQVQSGQQQCPDSPANNCCDKPLPIVGSKFSYDSPAMVAEIKIQLRKQDS
jgi:hypothetical protein